MQRRETVTDRLADVIRVVQLARKTGLLTVERDQGGVAEEGSIMFVNGQITDASFGTLHGEVAFNRLSLWTACRYSFVPMNPRTTAPLPPGSSSSVMTPPPVSNGNTPGLFPSDQNHFYSSASGTIPRRVREPDGVLAYFDHLGLSRLHRRLFLLIDGQRTVPDLAQLLGHRSDDIYQLLADLERSGLIEQ